MGKNGDSAARDGYYTKARSWADDREQSIGTSRRLAWIVAAIAIGFALFEAVALAMLAPLKESVPYLVLVDRHTGYAQVLKGADRAALTPDWALTQSLLAQYVTAREGFDITSIETDYRKVGLWSTDAARKSYLASVPASSPASPLRRLPRTSIVKVVIKSITPLQKDVALVRFGTERVDQGQEVSQGESWAAVVRYRFVNAAMSFDDRLINPLGFQVTRYRKDPEAAPVLQQVPSNAPSVAAAPTTPPASPPAAVHNGPAQ